MSLFCGWRRPNPPQPVVLDVSLLRDITRTQEKIDDLLDTLPEFQNRLRELAVSIENHAPVRGVPTAREGPTDD